MTISSRKTLSAKIVIVGIAGLMTFSSALAQGTDLGASTTISTEIKTSATLGQDRADAIEARQEVRAEAQTERQETRADIVEQVQVNREERQGALQEIRQQRILNLSANISNRMEAAIERIFTIIGRLETRIEKMKQSGVDTVAAEASLRQSASAVASARATLASIDVEVYNATTGSDPRSSWQSVRETYLEAGRLIRSSHQSLRETIALLKTALADADLSASAAVRAEASASTTTE